MEKDITTLAHVAKIAEDDHGFVVVRFTKKDVQQSRRLTIDMDVPIKKTSCIEARYSSSNKLTEVIDCAYSVPMSSEGAKSNFTVRTLRQEGTAGVEPSAKDGEGDEDDKEKLPDVAVLQNTLDYMSEIRALPIAVRPRAEKPLLLKLLGKKLAGKNQTSEVFTFLSLESSMWSVGTLLGEASEDEKEMLKRTWKKVDAKKDAKRQSQEGEKQFLLEYISYDGSVTRTVTTRSDLKGSHDAGTLFYLTCTWTEAQALAF